MIYFQVQSADGKMIAGNMQDYLGDYVLDIPSKDSQEHKNKHKDGRGVKSIEEDLGGIRIHIVVKDEADLLRSNSLFKKTVEVYKRAALDMWEHYLSQINAHAHTLTTIQGQMRQKIEGFARDDDFYADTHEHSIRNLSDIIKTNIDGAADLICYMHKRVTDMRAHMLGFEIVHAGTNPEINFTQVSLKRAILNLYTPFATKFFQDGTVLKFYFENDCQVKVDRNLFSLVMYNFFDNAVKYIKPETDIRLNFNEMDKKLDISMISLKMDREEISHLFDEGIRGKHARDIHGRGIGLFALKKALGFMGMSMYIDPKYEKTERYQDRTYVENHFIFSMK